MFCPCCSLSSLKAQSVSSFQIIVLPKGCGRSVWSITPSSGEKYRSCDCDEKQLLKLPCHGVFYFFFFNFDFFFFFFFFFIQGVGLSPLLLIDHSHARLVNMSFLIISAEDFFVVKWEQFSGC